MAGLLFQCVFQDIQAAVELAVGDGQRGQETHHLSPTAGVFNEQAVAGAFLYQGGDQVAVGGLGDRVLYKLQADHGAQAPDIP